MEGPFYESKNTMDEYIRRTWYTQKAPYVAPLPYDCLKLYCTDRVRPATWVANSHALYHGLNDPSREAYAQAYSRFQSKLGESAAWGENLAQYKQTFETAVDILELCLKPTRKIAKILNGFSKRAYLGSYQKRQGRTRIKTYRDSSAVDRWARPLKEVNAAYLQYVYGLKPLLSDLDATLQVLDKPKDFSWDIQTNGVSFIDYADKRSWCDIRQHIKCHARIAGTVTCTNPNWHKAQSLGITNPVALAYELIPFSFIFDYIYDVGSYLSAFDDMLGIKLTDAYVTHFNEGSGTDHYWQEMSPPNYMNLDWKGCWIQRRPTGSLPAPRPYLKLNLSHWKAIHACSVLASVGLLRNR